MKKIVIAAVAVLSLGTLAACTASAQHATTDSFALCADKGRWGWKITGSTDAPGSTFRDWQTNKVLGEIIGDGNCQDGWTMTSDVDPRIQGVPTSKLNGVETSSVATLRGSHSSVVTDDAGRITASWQGFAPEVLKGRNNGSNDKWKLVSTDGVNHTYKLVKKGNHPWPKGSTYVFIDQDIIDRDFKGGTATVDPFYHDKLRYAASRDTTTTVQDFDVETTKTYSYIKTRTFCPSVWTYGYVSPAGQVVAIKQGNVGPCVDKKYVVTRDAVSNTTRSVTNVVVGDRYVTPQN